MSSEENATESSVSPGRARALRAVPGVIAKKSSEIALSPPHELPHGAVLADRLAHRAQPLTPTTLHPTRPVTLAMLGKRSTEPSLRVPGDDSGLRSVSQFHRGGSNESRSYTTSTFVASPLAKHRSSEDIYQSDVAPRWVHGHQRLGKVFLLTPETLALTWWLGLPPPGSAKSRSSPSSPPHCFSRAPLDLAVSASAKHKRGRLVARQSLMEAFPRLAASHDSLWLIWWILRALKLSNYPTRLSWSWSAPRMQDHGLVEAL
eukprot:m.394217 g.394217  ORF g.394217 m.394217 type:complete len:261 (-) comp56370_c0_seq3:819-1601(-)